MNTFEQLATALGGMADRLTSDGLLAPLLPALASQAVASVRQNFALQQAPDGSAWPPLKREQRPALVKTGALLASIGARVEADGIGVFSLLSYAGSQNSGARIRRRSGKETIIPARQFLGIRRADLDAMARQIADHAAREAALGGGIGP